jgi:hypothetical protein
MQAAYVRVAVMRCAPRRALSIMSAMASRTSTARKDLERVQSQAKAGGRETVSPSQLDSENPASLSTGSENSKELAVRADDEAAVPDDQDALSGPSQQLARQVIHDLAVQQAVHKETLKAMEQTEQWQNYEAHVTFELNMLRSRYHASTEAMTPARRSQLAAHLKAKQSEVMEEHADVAATSFLNSLTAEEKQKLAETLGRIDSARLDPVLLGAVGEAAVSSAARTASVSASREGGPKMGDTKAEALTNALWHVSSVLGQDKKK